MRPVFFFGEPRTQLASMIERSNEGAGESVRKFRPAPPVLRQPIVTETFPHFESTRPVILQTVLPAGVISIDKKAHCSRVQDRTGCCRAGFEKNVGPTIKNCCYVMPLKNPKFCFRSAVQCAYKSVEMR